ncbi:MAG TPA: chemotaxis protein CheA [Spirochaetota bacterium]|nr:chemotaxis protein CheA [Spirochaetota bacterium]HOR43725.1 chemotaxis protein CheA [Spirochaetota bacterium]HPK55248.1 chemotaxis protein CheA [Spirochaetota bacterium]
MGFEAQSELFIEESLDLLKNIELPLMELEEHPDDTELINSVFRSMHTIKGSAGMFGFNDISAFTHDIESTFDLVRKGELALTSEIIELTLKAKDCIRELLYKNDSDEERDKRGMILIRFAEITGGSKKKDVSPVSILSKDEAEGKSVQHDAEKHDELPGESAAFNVKFTPQKEILLRGVRIPPLFDELATLGKTSVKADISSVPELNDFDPEHCYLSWDINIETDKTEADIRSVFIFIEDYASISIKKLGSIAKQDYQKTQSAQKGNLVVDRRRSDSTSIRVKNEKLDTLVNLVGEMVTLHARLQQESNKAEMPEFISIAESLGRLTADLRDIAMSVRMVPLTETFSSFNRLVFDLSKNLGKKMRLVTEGGDTELDKNVIEELRDPLMHVIRNCADHAIEMPEERIKNGKDETGSIKLWAEYTGANVRIGVADDGIGLDRDKILAKALERGLPVASDADDKTIFSLIFEPGFSTAEKTTDISGRGVGMDVVKKNIEKLRGSIDISTEKGKGTTITLTIPLTLAIIDGFMTEVCSQAYIFNLSHVRECIAYNASEESSEIQGLVRIREDYIPFIDMRRLFGVDGEPRLYPQIVVAEIEGTQIGFLVDKVVGHCQTVIKPLGKGVKQADMFSGASILGDGSIALVLDINHLITNVRADENFCNKINTKDKETKK